MNRKQRRKYLFDFAKEKIGYKNKFYKMIYFVETDDMDRILRTIDNNKSMKQKLYKILFPQHINEMCNEKLVFNKDIKIDSLRQYYVYIFKKNITKIEKYLTYKLEFEKYFFQGKYIDAMDFLNRIESEIGLSVWGISKKMFLFEKLDSLEKHKKYLNEIQVQANDDILLNTLFELESYFAESNTSYLSFKKVLDSYNEILKDNDIVRKYLDFKFNIERKFDMEEIKIAFMFDSQISIIDMYESFVISEQMRFVEGMEMDENELIVQDFRLENILQIVNKKVVREDKIEYYYLLESYTCGNYKKCIEDCNKYLKQKPQDFQCILLMIKSYILLNETPSFEEGLYLWVYNMYLLNEYGDDSIQKLFSYIKVVRGTSWEYKIIGFIARKTSMHGSKRLSLMSAISDMSISPNLVNYDCIKNKVDFLSIFKQVCPITYQLFLFRYGIGETTSLEKISDKNRKLIFETDRFIQENEYEKALITLDKIDKDKNYFLERVMRRQMVIYRKTKDYLSLVQCITNAILKNENIQKRIDIEKVNEDIIKNLTKEIKKDISYVVFVYLSAPSDYKHQRIAYSNYMDFNNYQSIKEIVDREEKGAVLISFLDKICIQHLIKRDIILNPDGNKANEIRIEILQTLIELDVENKKKYFSEIIEITKDRSIKDRIKQINQSRIFVDTENIKKDNELTLREDFNRYLGIKDFDEELEAYDIRSEDHIRDLKKIVDDMNEKIRNNAVYSQKIVVLKGIITIITEEFLFNEKYGLNTFLSSRIRHGYCKNQLTTIFQDFNLLSKKSRNNSDEYLINEYWDRKLPENSIGSKKIKDSLSLFTLNIELKVDEIKKDWLNIKYKEDNNALLDYTSVVDRLLVIDIDNIIDFNTFYNVVINFLWEYTLTHFRALKKKIQEELLNYFKEELNNLSNTITSIKEEDVESDVKTILSSINLCKSQIGGKILEFSNVFEKKDVTYVDFTMSDLVDTCLEITAKLNGEVSNVDLNKNIFDSNCYKGENFPYFVDILNIMINNALEHSGISNYSKLSLDIDIKKIEDMTILCELKKEFEKKRIKVDNLDFLEMSVSNTLGQNIDIEKLDEKISTIFKNTQNYEAVKKYSQSEGGTGLYKLYKTIQYNIDTPYTIIYNIEKNKFCISIVFGIMNIIA